MVHLPSWHVQQPRASVLQNCRRQEGVRAARLQGRLGPVERMAHVRPLAGSQMPVTGMNTSFSYMEPIPRYPDTQTRRDRNGGGGPGERHG